MCEGNIVSTLAPSPDHQHQIVISWVQHKRIRQKRLSFSNSHGPPISWITLLPLSPTNHLLWMSRCPLLAATTHLAGRSKVPGVFSLSLYFQIWIKSLISGHGIWHTLVCTKSSWHAKKLDGTMCKWWRVNSLTWKHSPMEKRRQEGAKQTNFFFPARPTVHYLMQHAQEYTVCRVDTPAWQHHGSRWSSSQTYKHNISFFFHIFSCLIALILHSPSLRFAYTKYNTGT